LATLAFSVALKTNLPEISYNSNNTGFVNGELNSIVSFPSVGFGKIEKACAKF
jgi:hypothetical protein